MNPISTINNFIDSIEVDSNFFKYIPLVPVIGMIAHIAKISLLADKINKINFEAGTEVDKIENFNKAIRIYREIKKIEKFDLIYVILGAIISSVASVAFLTLGALNPIAAGGLMVTGIVLMLPAFLSHKANGAKEIIKNNIPEKNTVRDENGFVHLSDAMFGLPF